MRIGIDARLYNQAGIGRYIRNLISNLEKIDKENQYFIFLLKEDFDNVNFSQNFTKVLADFRWYGVAEQRKVPSLLKKYNLDLVHFPHFNVPIFYSGKFIVTIHDLIHQHQNLRRASAHGFVAFHAKRFAYRWVFNSAVKRSQKIITVSNFVKEQLIDEWNVDPKRISLTYEAVEDNIINLSKKITEKQIKQTLEKFNVKPPFIFYVGNAHPHKNVEGLIKTFLELRKKYQYLQLVLSGNDHYFWRRIKAEFKQKDIIYTGFITDVELVAFYKNAKVFVMPSFEEGFGIPILEAMVCSCPVVSSNKGSLKEVGSDAAIYFDPADQQEMQEKIIQVLNSEKLRGELIKKGKERVKLFSWERLAQETLYIYNLSAAVS